jgi:hypothetical protein
LGAPVESFESLRGDDIESPTDSSTTRLLGLLFPQVITNADVSKKSLKDMYTRLVANLIPYPMVLKYSLYSSTKLP